MFVSPNILKPKQKNYTNFHLKTQFMRKAQNIEPLFFEMSGAI